MAYLQQAPLLEDDNLNRYLIDATASNNEIDSRVSILETANTLVVPSGHSLPTAPSTGQLFLLIASNSGDPEGLHIWNGSWFTIGLTPA